MFECFNFFNEEGSKIFFESEDEGGGVEVGKEKLEIFIRVGKWRDLGYIAWWLVVLSIFLRFIVMNLK